MRWIPILIVLALAGCTDSEPDSDSELEASSLLVEAPAWAIGDWWTFQNTDGNGTRSTSTVVVTGEDGGDWIVDTDDPDQALYDARTDVSYLGPVNKQTLAGSQGRDRVLFFDFPLELGKAWSTNWDGERLQMEVVEVRPDGRVHIEARSGSTLAIDYEYDAEAGFFGYVEFLDGQEQMAFRMERTDAGDGYIGDVVRYTLHDPMEFQGPAGTPIEAPFTVDDEVTELAIDVAIRCDGPGNAVVALQQPGDDGQEDPVRGWQPFSQPEFQSNANCPADDAESDVIDAVPGPWRLDARITAQTGSFEATIEPRTLTIIPIA